MELLSVSSEAMPTCVPGGKNDGTRAWDIVLRAREERKRAREKETEANEGSPASTCTVENAAFEDDSSKD